MEYKIINCLVCGNEMKVDEKTRYGLCWKCVYYERFDLYNYLREKMKRSRRRKKTKGG